MNKFPIIMKPENKSMFWKIKHETQLVKLREIVLEYIINNDKKGLYLVDENNKPFDISIVSTIIDELNKLGWYTQLTYNKSILFIDDNLEQLQKLQQLNDDIVSNE